MFLFYIAFSFFKVANSIVPFEAQREEVFAFVLDIFFPTDGLIILAFTGFIMLYIWIATNLLSDSILTESMNQSPYEPRLSAGKVL